MKNFIMKAEDLSKSFSHNGEQIHVLSHIDMEIEEKGWLNCEAETSDSSFSRCILSAILLFLKTWLYPDILTGKRLPQKSAGVPKSS